MKMKAKGLSSKGWHNESMRHSNAKKFGSAGGSSRVGGELYTGRDGSILKFNKTGRLIYEDDGAGTIYKFTSSGPQRLLYSKQPNGLEEWREYHKSKGVKRITLSDGREFKYNKDGKFISQKRIK